MVETWSHRWTEPRLEAVSRFSRTRQSWANHPAGDITSCDLGLDFGDFSLYLGDLGLVHLEIL